METSGILFSSYDRKYLFSINYQLDIKDLPKSYVRCKHCQTLIPVNNAVYAAAKLCHICAGKEFEEE